MLKLLVNLSGMFMNMNTSSLQYDQSTRTVSNDQGITKILSPQCATLLEILLQASPDIVTREQMKQSIWGHDVVSEDVINHLVCRLRRELSAVVSKQSIRIETIPKAGYRIIIKDESPHDMTYWLHRCSEWFKHLAE
ncbi:winged helix-turn-helix domain-containing protein [Alteromonas facilis]|uniref:winged helix-turn-helix domain-containing protein n=1 Tax=Alteromonas facilis TaxID=2048004 RepID=UPI0013DA49E3|nr:winged helix-turn-helix domain-containing protein [Alteromonas facilis]